MMYKLLPNSHSNVFFRHSSVGWNPESEAISYKQPCVYIMASQRNGTLYTGVTSDLVQRVWQHKNNFITGFTKKYNIHLSSSVIPA